MNAPGKARTAALMWQFTLAAVVLLLWQTGSATGFLDPFFFSRPTDIALRLGHWIHGRDMWQDLATTFCEAIFHLRLVGVAVFSWVSQLLCCQKLPRF